MTKTCKSCNWWKERSLKFLYGGSCSAPQFIYKPDIEGGVDMLGSMLLLYWDKDGYSASFSTGPDFGCIHYKEKN